MDDHGLDSGGSDRSLWLVIFTHGFIDTIGIALIAVGGDEYIQKRMWEKSPFQLY
jgi:hypothetical protein